MYIPKRTDQDYSRIAKLRDGDDDFDGPDDAEEEEGVEFLKLRENLDRMEEADQKYSERAKVLTQRLLTAQNPNIIDRDALIAVAAVQRERFFGCLSLPFSFFVFLLYAMSTGLHEDITNTYMIESGLRNVLGGGIGDVATDADVFDWIQEFVDKAFTQTDLFGDTAPKQDWNRVLMYNQVTGPIVLEQLRSKKELCFDGEGILGDMTCYPAHTKDTDPIIGRETDMSISPPYSPPTLQYPDGKDDYPGWTENKTTLEERQVFWESAFKVQPESRRLQASDRRLREARSEYFGKLPGGTPSGDAYSAFLYPNVPVEVAKEHVGYLQERQWLDAQTKQLTVKCLLLNAEVGRPRLEQVQVLFRFSRGGGIFARLTMESLFLKFDSGAANKAADFMFMFILLIITLMEIDVLIKARKAGTCRETLKKGWTFLEWCIIFFGWLCMLGYLIQDNQRKLVNEALEATIDANVKDTPAEKNAQSVELLDNADNMVYFTSYFRILQAEYHIILMFRFFTAFRAQPRLGVITDTLEASVIDIIHFLIVLVPTFCAYSISACFIYGRRMEEYSTFDSSIGMCFKMLMEGEFDWDNLSEEHYWTAAFWTWSFMLLLVLVMCNMVLAIVMDIYTDMRKNAGDSEQVWTTFYNLWQRLYRCRVWVSNRELLEEAEKMERLLTREDLLDAFKGMCDQQLDALLVACRYQAEQDSTQDMAIEDSMRMTMAIKLAIDKVNEDMTALQEGTFSEYDPSIYSEDGWLQDVSRQMATHNHWMLSIQWQLQQLHWQWGAMEKVHGQDARLNKGAKPWLEEDEADIVL